MKKIAWTGFVVFCSVVGTLAVVFSLQSYSQKNTKVTVSEQEEKKTKTNKSKKITLEELSKHNNEKDCWKAIHGKVYDFTDYLPMHPTAAKVFTKWCGKESTKAYDAKGGGRGHSQYADSLLERYYIGDLE